MNRGIRQGLAMGAGAALAWCIGAGAWAQAASAGASGDNSAQGKTLQMVPAIAELDKTIDAKKAKQGDPVTAKLQKDVQIPDAQNLPKNTVLEGHVDQAQASEHKSDSTVVVTFDKVKLKNGQELPIKATIVAVSEPALMQQNQGGAPAGDAMPAGGGAPMPSGGGGAPQGGGSAGAAAAPPPQPSAGAAMPEPGAGQPSQQSNKNGVPGVTLKSDIHDQNSATFSSKGKNVRVPSGTQMEVALTVIPAGVKLQQ